MAECDLTIAVHGAITRAMTAAEVADAVQCDTNAAHAALMALLRDGLISCCPNVWSPAPVVHGEAVPAALADAPTTAHDLTKRLDPKEPATSATGALCARNRTGLVEVDDAPNSAQPRRLETAVLSALSATPITALDLAKRLFSRPADHRAKNVNPTLYALKARGEVVQRATRPPTWSVPT